MARRYGKFRRGSARKRRFSRASAASTIARAWKIKKRRRRGSLLSRTALANRKAIKSIKRHTELKYTATFPATARTNFCGQLLGPINVDNWGMSHSTTDWAQAAAGAQFLTPVSKYCPIIMNPLVIKQAGQTVAGSVQSSGEHTRVGNDVYLSHVTFKITLTGGDSAQNGGYFVNVAQRQSLTALLLLDREPAPPNLSLSTPAPGFDQVSMPGQIFNRTPDNIAAIPPANPAVGDNAKQFEVIKMCLKASANPPGLSTANVATKNMDALSFYSKDTVMGKTGRFKILKKMKLSCSQSSTTGQQESVVRTSASKTMTYKGRLKLHFDGDSVLVPGNQTILLCLFSDTPTVRQQGGVPPTNWVVPPKVTVLSRVSFRDP